jgi:hypothetical protein
MTEDNVAQGQQREIPRERFRDREGRELEVKWPRARKEPKMEPSEGWALFEDRPDSEPEDSEDEIGYEGER